MHGLKNLISMYSFSRSPFSEDIIPQKWKKKIKKEDNGELKRHLQRNQYHWRWAFADSLTDATLCAWAQCLSKALEDKRYKGDLGPWGD